jgi:hypothetical protein
VKDDNPVGFVSVRQAKPGGSRQLKGTDHGNCSFSMKLPSGVAGNRAVEAWGCDDVSRNASEPYLASLKPYRRVAILPKRAKPATDREATSHAAVGLSGVIGDSGRQKIHRGTWETRRVA